MNYKTLSFAACDKYQTWGAEAIVAGTIMPYPKINREEVLTNFDKVDKELVESSEKTAKFLYKILSKYLNNVSVLVNIIDNYSFWFVYIDGKTICENISGTGIMNRVFNITVCKSSKE